MNLTVLPSSATVDQERRSTRSHHMGRRCSRPSNDDARPLCRRTTPAAAAAAATAPAPVPTYQAPPGVCLSAAGGGVSLGRVLHSPADLTRCILHLCARSAWSAHSALPGLSVSALRRAARGARGLEPNDPKQAPGSYLSVPSAPFGQNAAFSRSRDRPRRSASHALLLCLQATGLRNGPCLGST